MVAATAQGEGRPSPWSDHLEREAAGLTNSFRVVVGFAVVEELKDWAVVGAGSRMEASQKICSQGSVVSGSKERFHMVLGRSHEPDAWLADRRCSQHSVCAR